jgi:hypothetical protein
MDAADILYLGLDIRMTFNPLSNMKVLVSVSSRGCLSGMLITVVFMENFHNKIKITSTVTKIYC